MFISGRFGISFNVLQILAPKKMVSRPVTFAFNDDGSVPKEHVVTNEADDEDDVVSENQEVVDSDPENIDGEDNDNSDEDNDTDENEDEDDDDEDDDDENEDNSSPVPEPIPVKKEPAKRTTKKK